MSCESPRTFDVTTPTAPGRPTLAFPDANVSPDGPSGGVGPDRPARVHRVRPGDRFAVDGGRPRHASGTRAVSSARVGATHRRHESRSTCGGTCGLRPRPACADARRSASESGPTRRAGPGPRCSRRRSRIASGAPMTSEDLDSRLRSTIRGAIGRAARGYRSQRQEDAAPRGTTPASRLDARRRRARRCARHARRRRRAWPRSRTAPGSPAAQLEALEDGEPLAVPRPPLRPHRRPPLLRPRATSTSEGFAGVVEEHWGTALAGFDGDAVDGQTRANGGRHPSVYLTTGAVPAGHLSRYPGDGTHLRAFTQTDEVPGVRRAAPPPATATTTGSAFTVTGSFPAVPARYMPPRPVPLRPARRDLAHRRPARRGARRPRRRALPAPVAGRHPPRAPHRHHDDHHHPRSARPGHEPAARLEARRRSCR